MGADRWLRGLVRGLATLTAACGVAQPIFAGRFLSGSYSALAAHEGTGLTLAGLIVLTTVAAAFLAYRDGNWAPVRMGAVLIALTALQVYFGYNRSLGLHIPLGVLLVGGYLGQTMLAWRPPVAAPAEPAEPAEPAGPAAPVVAPAGPPR